MLSYLAGLLGGVLIFYGSYKHVLKYVYKLQTQTSLSKHPTYKNTYELKYIFQGREYSILLEMKRGPKRFVRVEDSIGNDVSEKVFATMGPNQDFHTNIAIPDEYFQYTYITNTGAKISMDDFFDDDD